jgi:hypothetical protein
MTYKEAYEFLLTFVDRPNSAPFVAAAKQAVNHAMRWAQRTRDFNYLERWVGIVYPKNKPFIEFTELCGGSIKNFKHIMLVQDHTKDVWGHPLRRSHVGSILREMEGESLRTSREFRLVYPNSVPPRHHRDWVDYPVTAFITAEKFGIYPVPTDDMELSLIYTAWMPTLVADEDTNFLLEKGWDYVSYRALVFFNAFLKEDARIDVSSALLNDTWRSLVLWDESLSGGPFPVDYGT